MPLEKARPYNIKIPVQGVRLIRDAMASRRILVFCCVLVSVNVYGFLWKSSGRRSQLLPIWTPVLERNANKSNISENCSSKGINGSAAHRPPTTDSMLSSADSESKRVQEKTSARVELDVTRPLLPEKDSMPCSGYLKKREELQKGEWVMKLHSYLLTLNKSISPHVNMVFGDYKHRRLVLNWITAAVNVIHPPLHNVLILSLDNLLCEFIANRTLPVECLLVSTSTIFNKNKVGWWLKGLMVRIVLLRVINYWGYDVASYDSDAVLLKNPQVLYDKRPDIDLFSAAGVFPFNVSEKWGFALCAGTLLFRATPVIGINNIIQHFLVIRESHAVLCKHYRL